MIKFFFKCLLVEFFVIGGFLVYVVQAYGDTPSAVVSGGKGVVFAYGKVGVHLSWNQAEHDLLISECPACVKETYTPEIWERNLSTCTRSAQVGDFKNYSEWDATKTKTKLQEKITKAEIIDTQQQHKQEIDWMKSRRDSLP